MKMRFLLHLCCCMLPFLQIARCDDDLVQPTVSLTTQNVYGFADFTTTIGNTVMIFSPSSIVANPGVEQPTDSVTTESTRSEDPTSTIETSPAETTEKIDDIRPSKPIELASIEQSTSAEPAAAAAVDSTTLANDEVPLVTKKPKKKKNKSTTTPAPSDAKFVVEAVSAVTPAAIILSSPGEGVKAAEAEDNDKFVVEPVANHDEPLDDEVFEHVDGEDVILQEGNTITEPETEYDFLSRQPTEFVEETYRVVNLKPSVVKKPKLTGKTTSRNVDALHPTGLVTKSTGTVTGKDGLTTLHETSVIGTYISGKYAQVLQSTSQIFNGAQKGKINPTSTLRILKTAAPTFGNGNKHHVVTPAKPEDDSSERSTRKLTYGNANGFKNRFRNRDDNVEEITPSPTPSQTIGNNKKLSGVRRNNGGKKQSSSSSSSSSTRAQNRNYEISTIAAEPVTGGSYSSRRNKSTRQGFKPTAAVQANQATVTAETPSFKKNGYKQKIAPSSVDQSQSDSTSFYKFKLNRAPGRWQYKTTPKPRVTIRKQAGGGSSGGNIKDAITGNIVHAVTPSSDTSEVNDENDIVQSRVDLDVDLDGSGSVRGDVLDDEETGAGDNRVERKLPIETIKVEISTPADFSDTYYEIATIKSPYTFQVGANKNTRYITVTSTYEKTLDPEPTATAVLTEPLTENILAPTSHLDREHNLLDSSLATLPAITLADDQPTPPLETLVETFSTTQLMLKTHILPIVRGTNTSSHTLIQTYHITRLVTATKTLPPDYAYQFNPSRTLNEFNSKLDEAGSELHLELEFGDENEDDEDTPRRVELPEDLDLANIGLDFDISEVDKSKAAPKTTKRPKPKPTTTPKPKVDELNPLSNLTPDQLALLRLLNPAAVPNVITTSKPVVKVETVYESHVLPIVNGASTLFSTISRPIATVTKTDYEIGTSTLAIAMPPIVTPPPINPILLQQQQQQLQQQQLQQQFQIQSTPVVQQAIVTQTDSKVLKLTFGARTAYTTLYNTRVVPTQVTSYITQSFIQPSAAYPGYFPAPYPNPYGPYVG